MRSNNLRAGDDSIAHDVARLAAMLEAVKAATPPEPEITPLDQCSLLSSPFPRLRRAQALSWNGRQDKLKALGLFLAASADAPSWLARMAMDAAIPVDHERELDDEANHLPALMRAAGALGLDPAIVLARPSGLMS